MDDVVEIRPSVAPQARAARDATPRFAVLAGRVHELRLLLSREGAGSCTIRAVFRDAAGGTLDPRLAGEAMRVPHLDPIEVEALPRAPDTDALRAAGLASRFLIPPPDAVAVELRVETPGVEVHRAELTPLAIAWRTEGKAVLAALREAATLRRVLLRRHLALPGDANPLPKRLASVPAEQAAAIRAQFDPVGSWDAVIERLASPDEGAEARDFEERRARRARQRERTIRVAFAGSARTLARLRCLADVFVLREAAWEASLDALAPDRILVETVAEPASREWRGAFASLSGALPAAGRGLVEGARARGIPVTLLVTAEPAEMGVWRELAERADAVVIEGDRAEWPDPPEGAAFVRRATEPMANPALRAEGAEGRMLVPVASDLYQHLGFAELLQRRSGYATLLAEFDYDVVPRALSERMAPMDEPVAASTSRLHQVELLQASDLVLLHGRSVRSDGQLVAIALDAVAAGAIPVIHGACDVAHPLVAQLDRVWSRPDLDELQRLYRIPWLRERRWRALFREVCRHHVWTAAERALVLGADPFSEGYDAPLLSALLVTKRPHRLAAGLETFRKQTARAKELILVLHMDEPPAEMPELRENERVFVVPQSWNLGRCLNMAIAEARGRYWAKLDDDDDYAATYLEELAHYYRATEADVVGRQAIYFHFAGKNLTLGRTVFHRRSLGMLPRGAGAAGAALSAAKREGVPPFSSLHRNGSDSEWIRAVHAADCRVACYDATSLTMYRDPDASVHTWQMRDVATGRTRYQSICQGNVHAHLEAPGARVRD